MPLTVLNDDEIRALLEALTATELEGFRGALAAALHEYSTGGQGGGASSSVQQPERISVQNTATGATTLFMPSSSSVGNGIKVITLTSASPTTTTTTSSSTTSCGTAAAEKTKIRPTGAITLFTPHGAAHGLLHAGALTAFRTALASLCVVQRRARVGTLLVFGCGEQAYWHVRLALKARGSEVKMVCFVVNRTSTRAVGLVRRFCVETSQGVKDAEGWARCRFELVTTASAIDKERDRDGEGEEEERREREVLQARLREADVVFCCTPSTEALFEAEWLESKAEGRLVVAIGSYTPQMRELPGELVRQAVQGEQGVIVVDTIDGALKEAGELIEAGVTKEQLVELGEVAMLDDATLSPAENEKKHRMAHLVQRLRTGNVIYKSVGFGLMDLSVGMYLVDYAKERGIGTVVQGF
ncbi:NAD(P)-binding protein [Canariomyces notabilis]|uniref:NAD(P)-binding protein n=1 Tax=Canariomyces notabilis TaxID=2074819 RepID=A0AAN6QGD4_9PEZI|nr:NAD(P)-binding protein [Canariomyces arenarius]